MDGQSLRAEWSTCAVQLVNLARNIQALKVYDPWIEKDLVKNQYHDLDEFLGDVDLVVIMVKHDEISENVDKLADKIVLDCHNICSLPGAYHI